MIRKYFRDLSLVSTLACLCIGASIDAAIITRAAVDIGSKGLKITVADIDTETRSIIDIHYSKEHPVPLKRDMLVSGESRFSENVQQFAIDLLAQLQQDLAQYQPVEWVGIATAASRESENAPQLYERIRRELNIDISIISQEEEGRIGFNTASAVSGVEEKKIISYDSGGGSFQLATQLDDAFEVIEGKFALAIALKDLIKEIRHQRLDISSSPNPVSLQEAQSLVPLLQARLPNMSIAFEQKLKNPETQVVGIGNQYFLFAFGAIATGKNTYTKEELWQAIEAHCDLDDQQLKKFAKPDEALVGMILLYSVMDGLGIKQLTYAFANGSCEGLLVDPKFWKIVE
jgi:exopolyphosphatase / guanosine-5'-triphosphate,3'-diphosphate pyrophosphatase